MRRFLLFLSLATLAVQSLFAASFLENLNALGRAKTNDATGATASAAAAAVHVNPQALAALSQDQVLSGLREALAKGVQHAVTNLGQADGFLKDAKVRIPMPETLRTVEKGLRAVGQGEMADQFVTTMNRAAEQAVPESASVLAESIGQMTAADAKTILTSTNTAVTDYFRRTAGTNLQARLLPIVKKATEEAGVTAAYKQMTQKANLSRFDSLGTLGGLGNNTKDALDIDAYVTRKALDGLYLKIAEQEKLIRANPAARGTELLQKVFGTLQK